MALAVVQQWTGTASRDDMRVIVVPTAGNWLIVTIAYRATDGTLPLATVADLARNYWVLCGSAPNAAGTGRVEVWACPSILYAPSALDIIYAAVSHIHTNDVGSVTVNVAEVSGFLNGFPTVESVVTAAALATTSLSLSMPAPAGAANCLCIAAVTTDDNTKTTTVTSAGWTALTVVNQAAPDVRLTPMWRTSTTGQTASWSASGALNFTGVVVAIRETGTVWTPPIAGRPAFAYRLGLGQGLDTPLPRVAWSDYTARLESIRATRGIPYELGRAQSSEGLATIQNPSGDIVPAASGSFDLYTPYQWLAAWPNGSTGKIYPVAAGWVEKFKRRWPSPQTGVVDAMSVDIFATLVRGIYSPARGEILRHNPTHYWPLSDPSGSTTALNLSGRSSTPLVGTVSKFGAGASGVADFGAAWPNVQSVRGDQGATGWKQSGLIGNATTDSTHGYCLVGQGNDFPPIGPGVTITGISQLLAPAQQPLSESTTLILRTFDPGQGASQGSVIKLSTITNGALLVTVWDRATHVATATNAGFGIYSGTGAAAAWALRFTRTGWRVDVILFPWAAVSSASGACNLVPNFQLISFGGEADQFNTGHMTNGTFGHIGIYDHYLTDGEVSQFFAAKDGWTGGAETPDQRIQRYLAINGTRIPRALDASDVTLSDDPGTGVISQAMGDVADYEAGLLYGRADGALAFRSKLRTYQQSAAWVLGDNTGAGEVPYVLGHEIDLDPLLLYNEAEVDNSWDYFSLVADPKAYVSVNQPSVDKRGARAVTRSTRLNNPLDAQGLADWLLSQYGQPRARLSIITVDPAAFPSLGWPFVLGVETGDLITVKVRPPVGPALSLDCRVLQLAIQATPDKYSLGLALASAPTPVVVLGDAVKGVLGNNAMGY